MKQKKSDQIEKKNSMIKNIGIAIGAWIKKYPSSLLIIPMYLCFRVVNPFLYSLLSSKVIGAITQGDVKNYLCVIAEILVALAVCGAGINVLGSFMQAQKVYTRLGAFGGKIFRKALRTDYQNVELQQNIKLMGKGVRALSGNSNGPEELMSQTINIAVIILGIGSYGTMILLIDWKILVAIFVMFISNVLFQTHAIKYADKHREEGSEIWRKRDYIREKSLNISAGKDIRIYQMKDWFHKLLNAFVKDYRDYERRLSVRWYYGTISDCLLNAVRDILAYSILIKRVLDGQIDIATFTLYIGLIGAFSSWIYSLSNSLNNLRRASHEFNDYFDFMNLPERKGGESDVLFSDKAISKTKLTSEAFLPLGDTPQRPAPEITFKNVGFKYTGAEKSTLQNLNFTIHSGEKIALVGNNGAGKTTIVKLLTGLYSNTEGEILVNGIPINQLSLDEYQDNISVLFQDTVPMAFSIKENVSSVDAEKTDNQKVATALEKAGLKEKVDSLKNKDETYLTQNLDDEGILLSGGETQKLLLAKAIYKNGKFLILDEPTSALDPLAESKIYEEYNEMAADKTAVFISHRLASTKFCDKIMFLDNGQIAEFGTHEELMALGGKYKEMFDIQSQYYV